MLLGGGPALQLAAPSPLASVAGLARSGQLQALRPLQHKEPLEAQADGQVEDNGGGPQASGIRAVRDEDVITQVRGQGDNPQDGSQPVALGQRLAIVPEPDPDRASPQPAKDGREYHAADDGGEGQRMGMVLAQELVSLQHADDQQDHEQAQCGGVDRAGRQLPVDQQGQDS